MHRSPNPSLPGHTAMPIGQGLDAGLRGAGAATPSHSLPRAKFGSSDDSDYETDDDVPVTTPSGSDPVDSDTEVPSGLTQTLADKIHALTTHFDAYWDESQEHRVALSQDIDTIMAEMATICASRTRLSTSWPDSWAVGVQNQQNL